MTTNDIHHPAMERLRAAGVLAVLRGSGAEKVARAGTALIEAGIEVLEVTFTVPGCATAIAELKVRHPGAVIGAGTVSNSAQIDAAIKAGADFIVTPGATKDLLWRLATSGRPFLPGVMTPSEAMTAMDAGAAGVKIFPGSVIGPTGLSAFRGPFPDLVAVPTGGVSPENVRDWFKAGAFAVGAGGDLAPASAIDSGDTASLRRNAAHWIDALAAARSPAM